MLVLVIVVVVFVVILVVVVLVLVIVVAQLHRRRAEFDGRDVVCHVENRRPSLLHRFESVHEAFFQMETVGHNQRGALHPAPVLQRGLEGMGVSSSRYKGDHLGQPITGHVRHHVAPYRCRHHHCRHTIGLSRVVVPTARRNQCQHGQHEARAKCKAPRIDNESHSCKPILGSV